MITAILQVRQHLLTGVSYAIPFIACGGILIAAAIAVVPMTANGPDFSNSPVAGLAFVVGNASFALLLPILAGYIAYAMAGKPGLVSGFVGGYLSGHLDVTGQVSAGFLGALFAGLLAGFIVNLLKKASMPKFLRPIMPILIIPIASSAVVGVVMLKVVGTPIAELMTLLSNWLNLLNGGNRILLGAVLGGMIAFDMGGPVNKAAFFFGAAMLKEGNFAVMGACAAAICTPPLGLGVATLVSRHLWTNEQRESGSASLVMGLVGITEGAIPFAATDPLRVIPCIMLGSMTAAMFAMLGGVGDHAPHGGPIVLPIIDHRVMYVVAILMGTAVTALSINLLKAFTKSNPANSVSA
jgi:fructose-specific phosphotransferase system IIC component